jgi:hypothetical protein
MKSREGQSESGPVKNYRDNLTVIESTNTVSLSRSNFGNERTLPVEKPQYGRKKRQKRQHVNIISKNLAVNSTITYRTGKSYHFKKQNRTWLAGGQTIVATENEEATDGAAGVVDVEGTGGTSGKMDTKKAKSKTVKKKKSIKR